MSEEKDETTHIEKRRTTALKIIVDEKTKQSYAARRAFLGNLFDFPEYAQAEEDIVIHCTVTNKGEAQDQILFPEALSILKENNIDCTAFKGYREEKKSVFKKGDYELDRRVKEVTGITESTYLHYKFASSEENNNVTIYYLLFQLQTTGKTKTEIKTIHKENVCKFLNYLRMRKVSYSYDCEWSFEGNRACSL